MKNIVNGLIIILLTAVTQKTERIKWYTSNSTLQLLIYIFDFIFFLYGKDLLQL
jgi:hypothetical protein